MSLEFALIIILAAGYFATNKIFRYLQDENQKIKEDLQKIKDGIESIGKDLK